MSTIDPVSGLRSGLHFDQQFNSLLFHAEKASQPVVLLLLDLTGLKHINRQFGWETGDRLLREFARALTREESPAVDLWHLGGDAFVVAMVGATTALAEAYVAHVAQTSPPIGETGGRLEFNYGWSVFPDDGHTAKVLMRAADARKDRRRG